jgi:hypothetical protein
MKFFVIFNLKISVKIKKLNRKVTDSRNYFISFFCDKKKRNRNGKIHSYHEVKGMKCFFAFSLDYRGQSRPTDSYTPISSRVFLTTIVYRVVVLIFYTVALATAFFFL